MSLLSKDSPFWDSVVEILDGDMDTIGSGIFCGPEGVILTAAHVVAGQKEIHIRNTKMHTWVVQKICPGDFSQDLALIKTDARNHPYIQLADDDPEKGDEVKVIGHPMGVIHLIESTGSVKSPGSMEDIMILSNSAMPGNSGSPVFNKNNQLVGILTKTSYFTKVKDPDAKRNAFAVSLQNLRKVMEIGQDSKSYHPVSDIASWAGKSPEWNPESNGDEKVINLGRTYLNNSYEDRQTEVATAIFVAEADKGNPAGIRELANLHYSGVGVQKDQKKALEMWKQSANQGDVEAMLRIGMEYHSGENLPLNQREAFKWFRKSAEEGQAQAMGILGAYYLNGWGIDSQDWEKGVKWLRKACELGDPNAQYNLGVCYHHGMGIGKDEDEAYKCFKNAAEHGDANAQTMLGYYYQTGTGVDQDEKEAMNWYKKSALQGDEKAAELIREARYK
jgi:TPR repeat protein